MLCITVNLSTQVIAGDKYYLQRFKNENEKRKYYYTNLYGFLAIGNVNTNVNNYSE